MKSAEKQVLHLYVFFLIISSPGKAMKVIFSVKGLVRVYANYLSAHV